jgi:carbon monoxide dehydrogenase subunit G
MFADQKFRVKAPIQKVWEFMLDPQKIGPCIPGCDKIEVRGKDAYESTITIKLPIFSITARSTTTITETTPPQHLKSVTEGQYDLGGGTFHQETVVDLEEISDNEVEVSYSTETKLEGGLAGFGEKIMKDVAKALGEQFARNIQTKLEEDQKDQKVRSV